MGDDGILKQEEVSGFSKEPLAFRTRAVDAAARTVGPKRGGQNERWISEPRNVAVCSKKREGRTMFWKEMDTVKARNISHKWLCSWGYHFINGVKPDL